MVTLKLSHADALALRCILLGAGIHAAEEARSISATDPETREFFEQERADAARLRAVIVAAMERPGVSLRKTGVPVDTYRAR